MTTTQNNDKMTKKAVKKAAKKAEKKAAKKAEKKAAKKAEKKAEKKAAKKAEKKAASKVSMNNVVFNQRAPLPPKQILPRKPNARDIIAMHVLASKTSKLIRELTESEKYGMYGHTGSFRVSDDNCLWNRKLYAEEFFDMCNQLHKENPKIIRKLNANEEFHLFANGGYYPHLGEGCDENCGEDDSDDEDEQ